MTKTHHCITDTAIKRKSKASQFSMTKVFSSKLIKYEDDYIKL